MVDSRFDVGHWLVRSAAVLALAVGAPGLCLAIDSSRNPELPESAIAATAAGSGTAAAAATSAADPGVVSAYREAGDDDTWSLLLPAPLQDLLELIDESIDHAAGAIASATDPPTAGGAVMLGPSHLSDPDLSAPTINAAVDAAAADPEEDDLEAENALAADIAVNSLADEDDPDPGAGQARHETGDPAAQASGPDADEGASAPLTDSDDRDSSPTVGHDPEATAAADAEADQENQDSGDDPTIWGPPLPDPDSNEFGASPIDLLGGQVAPGGRERLHWTTGQSFSGSVMETPVVVVHGSRRGPRLCLTAGIHGDELNGIEVVRRLAYKIEPEQLAGTVVAVPIVNLLGFSRGSRYLPDRRDLNRFFPGSPYGSSASRIAHSFFTAVIEHCDALVDIHTGSMDRANLPQVRGDLTNPQVLEFTRGFGATAVLHSPGTTGMLRVAASTRRIPAVTFEIGAPMRLQPDEIEHGVQAIETLLNKMGMIEKRRRWREPQAVFYESRWVRVDHGGMLFSDVALGDRVRAGQRLGRVIDPVSNRAAQVHAPEAGRIIGMALNQLVLPGFAAYNLGIAASEEQVVIDAVQEADPDDERYLENDQLDQDRRARDDEDGEDRDHTRHRDLEHGD